MESMINALALLQSEVDAWKAETGRWRASYGELITRLEHQTALPNRLNVRLLVLEMQVETLNRRLMAIQDN